MHERPSAFSHQEDFTATGFSEPIRVFAWTIYLNVFVAVLDE
jgi:hypothetical protein